MGYQHSTAGMGSQLVLAILLTFRWQQPCSTALSFRLICSFIQFKNQSARPDLIFYCLLHVLLHSFRIRDNQPRPENRKQCSFLHRLVKIRKPAFRSHVRLGVTCVGKFSSAMHAYITRRCGVKIQPITNNLTFFLTHFLF